MPDPDVRIWDSARSFWILKIITKLDPKPDKVWQISLGAGGSGVTVTAEFGFRIHTVPLLTSWQSDPGQPPKLSDSQVSICGVAVTGRFTLRVGVSYRSSCM